MPRISAESRVVLATGGTRLIAILMLAAPAVSAPDAAPAAPAPDAPPAAPAPDAPPASAAPVGAPPAMTSVTPAPGTEFVMLASAPQPSAFWTSGGN